MQKILFAILFSMFISTHSLKLLVNDDYVEDDDEAWESDIEFSYKPFAGKCKTDSGAGAPIATAAASTIYENGCNALNGGVLGDGVGCMTMKTCASGYSAAEQAKYCTISPATKASKFWEIANALKAKAVAAPKWKLSKFVHYVAKLASMGNTQLAAAQKVESFDIKTDMTEMVMYLTVANGFAASADYLCYSKIGMAWAKNDPKVKNIDGDEFEIMATGTFSLLSLRESSSSKTVLEASATIDRAGTRCGATYIQNATLSGQWVEDIGVPSIQVKAEAAVPKVKALQVNFAGEWQHAASKFSYAAVEKADAKQIIIQLNQLKVLASVDSHRIHEAGVTTKRFANFLNVNFQGISKLSGFSVGGLLGRDSHAEATELPDGCESEKLISEGEGGMLSSLEHA